MPFILLQNTYTNAEKLLAAAEELAHTGECDAEGVYSVARELEAHVAAFATRVDQRRRRLDLAVLFYTHEKEVSSTYIPPSPFIIIEPIILEQTTGSLK